MRARGALHVHSTFSHDGTLSIAELAAWYRSHGFNFVAMGEHSQDMDLAKVEGLVRECATASDSDFLMVPGIEFTCNIPGMHILGVGVTGLTPESDPIPVARHIREQGGFAVLAHPKRFGWECSEELLRLLHAAEIWNIAYDGKYLPSVEGQPAFRRMRDVNPGLLAVASHDFHRKAGFYNMHLQMDFPSLTKEAIMENLYQGEYRIRSRWFGADSNGHAQGLSSLTLALFGRPLSNLRRARNLMLRWSS